MISVVIPVLNQISYAEGLFNCISKNSILPSEIFLIDDNSDDNFLELTDKFSNLPITYIKHEEVKGVNYSWNEGISLSKSKLISVLNSDIELNDYFFEKIIKSYKENTKWGIICPKTITNLNNLNSTENDKIILENLPKREGWAWTAKKEVLDKIKPIPDFLRTYCGDDYIFFYSTYFGYVNLKITNSYVYHYGGKTVGVTPKCFGEREREKVLWNAYKNKVLKEKK